LSNTFRSPNVDPFLIDRSTQRLRDRAHAPAVRDLMERG
jgi:hypothetical protein